MEATPAPPSFDRYGPDEPLSPVVVSVPHAGREYPEAMQTLLTVPIARLTTLEDRHVDAVARLAAGEETMFVARRARGWIDLNRSPVRDRDPQVDAGADPRAFAAQASDKVRSGIGLIPRRAGGAENMWRRKLSDAEVVARIAEDHAPYHAALAAALGAAHARFGIALLLDLHSMPPLPGVSAAQVVLGNRHGHSGATLFTDTAAAVVRAAGLRLAVNHPYAGGHILASHARPRAGIHALQLEIDRSLYLDDQLDRPGSGLATTAGWVRAAIDALAAAALATTHRIAAE
ncbi:MULTISPECIES: N-formylglutamate amidohydrolase [unclassified Sphingomonas]|uniref:N-formylglutamate amidohydrolase n=1 Tax=unclassified Sphingomonas TaxID=196159 RepID=UPI0006FA1478|nr:MULTISPECIES: N-formylglutamate amidohydrolase [unclassified Sphingomonas]KQM64027.1 N-formylglutamate amidohydrolase [Sphingomonas sp. Leaf16]KQN13378.1 N-formylglutamate amidohydrolase [Sphingomonas sp. Leaf29]KQN21322.1 N-formylglutamate amidohydrolase [Sphingomonas sp. Leaf32]